MDVPAIMTTLVSYGYETDDEMTDQVKLDALNEAYWDACARESWPFLEASASLTFSGSSMVPTNDPGNIGTVLLTIRGADGFPLEPWRLDDFYQYYGSQLTLSQSPRLYFFEAGKVSFYPVPGASDTVTVKYVKIPSALTLVSSENAIVLPPKYHRSVLVLGTLARLAMVQDDTEMVAAYTQQYERALALMVGDLLEQQSDRTDFIHVNDMDNYDYS